MGHIFKQNVNKSKMTIANLNQELKPTFHLLKYTFGLVPIVAGIDKFTDLLTQWENILTRALHI